MPLIDDLTRDRWRRRLLNGHPLDEMEGLELLADYGLNTPRATRANTAASAVAAAQDIGFPVALKTIVPGIKHKSDQNGVILNLSTSDAVEKAYADLAARLGPQVIVAAMAHSGVEIALGLINDPQFGAYVMVASGGIWIEMLKDRAVALPPFGPEKAGELIQRLKVSQVLEGGRGRVRGDRQALVDALVRFSMLAADLGDLISEMDVNPLLVSAHGCVAVDALLIPASQTSGSNTQE